MAVFRRLLRRNFGLRARIIGVVVITTAVTLGVAALVLLPQLEQSLRKAAEKTLSNEIASARRDRVFDKLARIHYADLIDPLPVPPKSAKKGSVTQAYKVEFQLAKKTGQRLARIEASLKRRLGASSITLIGYIDQTGHGGSPVVAPTDGNAPSAAQPVDAASTDALAGAPYNDVTNAYRENRTIVHLSNSGGPEVRAAIPLRTGDAVLAVRKSIDEIPSVVATVQQSFLIAVIPGMLLTLLLAIPLASTLVRRLRQLRQAALRLAVESTGAGVDFPASRARDEVGDLARSFAIVQRRLRQQEEARRAFVATASHELRTPLASLEGMLELLAEDLRNDTLDLDDAAALLDRARAQSRRLARLASDLLDLSRIDAEVELRSEPVELTELGRAVLAEFELRALDHGVTPLLDDGGGGIWALADPGSVAQILRILVDNALRVAPPGTEIMVAVTGGSAPALHVIDQGPGVPPADRALIFERFMRGRETGGVGGFGLGLAIGRELAERMGGSLVLSDSDGIGRELAERMGGSLVLSDSDGIGATFTLTLRPASAPTPLRRPTAAGV